MVNVLFAHPNFPAQFRHLATALASSPDNNVYFLTKNERPEWVIPGVTKLVYQDLPINDPDTKNPYLAPMSDVFNTAFSCFEFCKSWRDKGNNVDLIVGHSGWGQTIFLKDLFPASKFIGYFEWYFEPLGYSFASMMNDPDVGVQSTYQDVFRSRISNTAILHDLALADFGVCATRWQRNQFPTDFLPKLHVIHEGIDTDYFAPSDDVRSSGSVALGLGLSPDTKIVTYTSRALEPIRGFPIFMRSASKILSTNLDVHIVVVADETRVCYGIPRPDGLSYKEYMIRELKEEMDWNRIHFLPPQDYGNYLQIIQSSDCHVYLTKPYVLSWSFLEVLSCATPLVASSTPPVQEIVGTDAQYCSQADFWDSQKIADSVLSILETPLESRERALKGRELVIQRYSISDGLQAWNDLMKQSLFGA